MAYQPPARTPQRLSLAEAVAPVAGYHPGNGPRGSVPAPVQIVTEQLEELLPPLPQVDAYAPENIRLVRADGTGHFTTLTAAMAAVSGQSSTYRFLIIVEGAISETATIVAKSYVDVLFRPGTVLNVARNPVSHGVTFTDIDSAVWAAEIPGTAEIRRTAVTTPAGANNYVVSVTNAGDGLVSLVGLILRNMVVGSAHNYGIQAAKCNLHNVQAYGAGNAHPYGAVLNAQVNAFGCDFYGGDTLQNGGGGNSGALGCLVNLTHTGLLLNCRAYGGVVGVGWADPAGFWVSRKGDIFGIPTILQNCVGYGGTGGVGGTGIVVFGGASALLIGCTGYSSPSTPGHGISITGQPDDNGAHALVNCVGVCRCTSNGSAVQAGLFVQEAARDVVQGGAFYGSPHIADSPGCAIYLANDTLSDPRRLILSGVLFMGGGSQPIRSSSAGSVPTQQTGCYAARIDYNSVLASMGLVDLINCAFYSNEESAAIYVTTNAQPGVTIIGGIAAPLDPAIAAIESQTAWANAPIHGMALRGILTNVTPDTPSLEGSNFSLV